MAGVTLGWALVAALLAWGARAGAQARCRVAGTPEELAVTVAPDGVAPFDVAVAGSHVNAEPGAASDATPVTIDGMLSFHGVAGEVSYRPAVLIHAEGGQVQLDPLATIRDGRAAGEHLVGDASAGGFVLRGIDLPCRALTLDPEPATIARFADLPRGGDGTEWVLARVPTVIRLRRAPRDGSAAVALVPESPDSLSFRRFGVSGRWFYLGIATAGAAAMGWVHASEVEPLSGYAAGSGEGLHGRGSHLRMARTTIDTYEGPAVVRAGALVLASPRGNGWAWLRADAKFWVTYHRGDATVALHDSCDFSCIEGIEGHAFVAASLVELPPGWR